MRVASLLPVVLLCACSPRERRAEKAAPSVEDPAVAHDEEGKVVPATTPRTWNFEDAKAGAVPAGMTIGETNPHNHPATWAVVARDDAPSAPHAFGVTACENPKGAVFEVALIDDTSYRDLEAEVWIRAVAGEHDQGGGLVWRAKDLDNYYVARWNAIEGNLRFYVVIDSERAKLAEVDVALDPGKWHRMHLIVEGNHFEVSVDEGAVLTLDHDALGDAGRIGLWTKTDAKTLFDDLSVSAL